MKCSKVSENLSAHLDKALDEATTKSVSEHLASCPACRKEFNLLKATWKMLDEFKPVPVPEGFADRIMERVQSGEIRVTPRHLIPAWVPYLASAAVLLLTITIGIFYSPSIPQMNESNAVSDSFIDELAAIEDMEQDETLDISENIIDETESESALDELALSEESFDELFSEE
ncbi:MAG: zf-HC2 domain-containing protein [Planctomycetes bacterium]|nr:zf-HC2 domain-containing protein [Planctomycetota bacterium]